MLQTMFVMLRRQVFADRDTRHANDLEISVGYE